MTRLMHGWGLDVNRGPDWVFVRLRPPPDAGSDTPSLAEDVWEILSQHMVYRLVLEMDDVTFLSSRLVGQLVLLHKRVHTSSGIMRLCGLNAACQQVLQVARLDQRFPNYQNREDAVLGRPRKPR